MDVSNLIALLSGIALFLFGMSLMGDGLKRVAGSKLEGLLYKLTNTQWKAILLGTGVTAVIQSSSATSVMVVGFVNSGMMHFRQAIGIVLGAILGTSVTGWILCLSELGGGWVSLLSASTLTGVVSVVGILIRTTAKRATHRHLGDILLGFSVLMYGMSGMSAAVAPLKEMPAFVRLLTTFSNPFLGFLAGAVFTSVLQSASAAVGILQALAMTGSITFGTAFPLIMGIAVGAALPVLLASAGASIQGRRTALVYLLIDLFGAAILGTAFYLVDAVVHFSFLDAVMSAVQIAALNTAFRLATVLVLAPLTGMLEALTCALLKEPEDGDQADDGPVLEDRFLAFPALALDQCQEQMNRLAELSCRSVFTSLELLRGFTPEALEQVAKLEDRTDRYEDALGTYILKLTKGELNTQQNRAFTKFLHAITDLERMGDHALNIAYIARDMEEQGVAFTGSALAELSVLQAALTEILNRTYTAFTRDDQEEAASVEPLEEVIDDLCDEMKDRHVERMKSGGCTMVQGIAFNDLLTNFERISDHCSNLALATIEVDRGSFQTHASPYHTEVQQARFTRLYETYRRQFQLKEVS